MFQCWRRQNYCFILFESTVGSVSAGVAVVFGVGSWFGRAPTHGVAVASGATVTSTVVVVGFRAALVHGTSTVTVVNWVNVHVVSFTMRTDKVAATGLIVAAVWKEVSMADLNTIGRPPENFSLPNYTRLTAELIPRNPASSLPPLVWIISTKVASDLSILTSLVHLSNIGPAGSSPVTLINM